MNSKINEPSDLIAWLYDNVDKRTALPKGENYNLYRRCVEKIAINNSNFAEFKNDFFLEYEHFNDSDLCLASMNVISHYFIQDYDIKFFGLPTIKKGESLKPLNVLFADKYLVYPKSDKSFIDIINQMTDGDLRKKAFSNPVNRYLENYIVVKKTDIKDFRYKIITYNDLGYAKKLRVDKNITLGFVPFIKEEINTYFEVARDLKSGNFIVEGVKNVELGEKLKQRYLTSLSKILSDEKKPEIILFPEMILTKDIVEALPQYIKSLKISHSCLILAGTLWEDNANTAYLYNHKGDLIAKQNKFYAYEYTDDKYTIVEKLDVSTDHILNILDIKGIGRIAIFICRDMKHNEYLNLLRLIDVNILLAPSYSRSNDVLSEVSNLVENNHTSVVYLNACSSKKEKIGKIVIPAKEGNDRSSISIDISNDKCTNCDELCEGIIFNLDVEKIFS